WTADDWQLNLMIELDGQPIGSQSIHADRLAVMRTVHTGSWLGQAFHGRGFGREMRAAVLEFAFGSLGTRVATTEAFLDNHASARVSRSLGYEEDGRGALAPEGVARETQRFRMTVERWRSRPRPAIEVEGFEACRELFGAQPAAGPAPFVAGPGLRSGGSPIAAQAGPGERRHGVRSGRGLPLLS
ncbi:MAG: GNAT family N-acetyltransferase, partial [Candidatus Limnocylindrales bacterium]